MSKKRIILFVFCLILGAFLGYKKWHYEKACGQKKINEASFVDIHSNTIETQIESSRSNNKKFEKGEKNRCFRGRRFYRFICVKISRYHN